MSVLNMVHTVIESFPLLQDIDSGLKTVHTITE